MNRYLILVALIFFCPLSKASAQNKTTTDSLLGNKMNREEQAITAKDAVKMLGKDVYLYDEVRSRKTINDSLTILTVGSLNRAEQVLILIKGSKTNKACRNVQHGKWHFSGVAIKYEGQPAIIITHVEQLGTQIQI